MIRINLLPELKKKARKQIQLPTVSAAWPMAATVIYLVVIASVAFMQHATAHRLSKKIAVAKEESEKLAPQLAKIKQLTSERQEVNKRLEIIRALDRTRYFRVKSMNDLSRTLPPNVWLTDFEENSSTSCSIAGVAFTNFSIADYMRNLEESKIFTGVGLTVAERGEIDNNGVMKFALTSRMIPQ